MLKRLITSALLLIPTFTLAQILGFSLTNGETKVQIPIEIHNNLVVVPIILNNQLPLRFILDTGVRTSILTEKAFSDILHLAYTKKYTLSGPGGQKLVDAYVTNNVTIDMPGVHGAGHALLVLDQDYLELRNSLGTDVHGILGYELFSRFVVKIDYEKHILTLIQPDHYKPSRKYQAIPITVEDTKPYVLADLKLSDTTSLRAKLLMDTGASHGLFLDPESDKNIKIPAQNVSSSIGRGLGGVIMGKIGRVPQLSIGKYSITDVVASYPDPNSYLDTMKLGGSVFRNGAIGGEVLSRFDVAFNFPAERIYLKKNHAFKRKFYYNLSGLTLAAKGASLRKFEISFVRPLSSAAKAGLRVGDAITSINGVDVVDLDLNTINGFFNSKPGKKIKVDIERDGVVMRKEFRLESQI